MARLHEYEGKALLAKAGVTVPRGGPASTPDEAFAVAKSLPGRGAVVKIQAWMTGRAAIGGVAVVDSPEAAREAAARLLALKVGRFPVEKVIVEERLPIRDEWFVSVAIDDAIRRPVLLVGRAGGSGVEERASQVERIPFEVCNGSSGEAGGSCGDGGAGIDPARLKALLSASGVDRKFHERLVGAIVAVAGLARSIDARSIEINPLVTTHDDRVVAADCRMTIDDYAVYRHPELGIEIARELDHPSTNLERIAYRIEQADHRGTFYFAQLPVEPGKPVIGFHGAGGGGSMMSMDAITTAGFAVANFTDTSGNPSVAKVYRAARIILAQPGLVGYFGSGSGVASQEQYHSAYGLAKAFTEMNLSIPAVIRLGGNSEDRAVEILREACKGLPAPVEGYRKDDTPALCAARFRALVEANRGVTWTSRKRRVPGFVGAANADSFVVAGGRAWVDHASCDSATTELVVKHGGGVFKVGEGAPGMSERAGKPVLAITEDEAAKKDSELIACEIECLRAGRPVMFVDLPIEGLD